MMYGYLFTVFFRIGLFGFGGGLAMLPLIFQSVQDFGIMTAQEFSELVALSQVTPGPMAVNAATYVGFNYAGIAGALAATFGVCLPAFLLTLIVATFLEKFNDSTVIQGAFSGIRPVTVGLIASASIIISETVLVKGAWVSQQLLSMGLEFFNLVPIVLFAVTVLLVGLLKMKPIRVMLLMGAAGALLCG